MQGCGVDADSIIDSIASAAAAADDDDDMSRHTSRAIKRLRNGRERAERVKSTMVMLLLQLLLQLLLLPTPPPRFIVARDSR